MTLPSDEEFDADNTQAKPIRVSVEASETQSVAPEFTSCNTVPIPQAGTPGGENNRSYVRLCPRNYHRYRTKFVGTTQVQANPIVISTQPDQLTGPNPQGIYIYASGTAAPFFFNIPDYDGMQALYATCVGGVASIGVMDQNYGKVQ